MKTDIRIPFQIALLSWLLAAPIRAQIGTAAITGQVTDPSGAAVAQVALTLIQTHTNFSFSAITNQDGLFRVQPLRPDTYLVTVASKGFNRAVRDNIILRTGDTLAVNVAL